jgi:hypothetical protein
MAVKFEILDFISGLTGFVFDKSVLTRIALEREVADITSYDELDAKTIDLIKADLLYVAYVSPNIWASHTNQHGSYSRTVGHQTMYTEDKEKLYQMFMAIYKKYGDEKFEEIEESQGNLQWL